MDSLTLNCNAHPVSSEGTTSVTHKGFTLRRLHKEGDPDGFCRFYVSNGLMDVELLPAKGMTVGQAWHRKKPVFWNPPIPMLQDLSKMDIHNDIILLNGEPKTGFKWLESFMGGIELMGLRHWGAPWTDPKTGEYFPLHGEANCIPVTSIEASFSDEDITVKGSYLIRTFKGDAATLWFYRGEPTFKVEKTIKLLKKSSILSHTDCITNVSDRPLKPDWGYHITFFAEEGAQYLTPSRKMQQRFGGAFEESIETWKGSKDPRVREEYGIIHKGLKTTPGALGNLDGVRTMVVYASGKATMLTAPPSRYYQTWLSAGGKGGKEFVRPDGTSLLFDHWNGIGCEIGASALDHDGIEEESVPTVTLDPGESVEIPLLVEPLASQQAKQHAGEINAFSKGREKVF